MAAFERRFNIFTADFRRGKSTDTLGGFGLEFSEFFDVSVSWFFVVGAE